MLKTSKIHWKKRHSNDKNTKTKEILYNGRFKKNLIFLEKVSFKKYFENLIPEKTTLLAPVLQWSWIKLGVLKKLRHKVRIITFQVDLIFNVDLLKFLKPFLLYCNCNRKKRLFFTKKRTLNRKSSSKTSVTFYFSELFKKITIYLNQIF